MEIILKNDAGLTKQVKVGFSWTTFFFGFFPALFRGSFEMGRNHVYHIEAIFGVFTFGNGSLVSGIVFSFIYNKIYIKELIEKGYKPAARSILEHKNILTPTA